MWPNLAKSVSGPAKGFPAWQTEKFRNAKKGHVTGLCKARLCPEMWPKLPRSVFRACKGVSGLANDNLETLRKGHALRKDMRQGFARQGCVQKCGQSCRKAFPSLQRGFRPSTRHRNAKKGHVMGQGNAVSRNVAKSAEKRFRACKEVSGLASGNLETLSLRKDMRRGFARQGCVQKCGQSCREAFPGLQMGFPAWQTAISKR